MRLSIVFLCSLAFSSAQSLANSTKVAADYGRDVTIKMLPLKEDSDVVRKQKCDRLIATLVDSKAGNEDFSGVSNGVLLNLRGNFECAADALSANDSYRLLSSMSIMLDAANELFRRLSAYAEKRDKDYNELLAKYSLLTTLAGSRSSRGDCESAIETQIDGEYNGWDDEVIYKMTNGQIWQQRNYHYHYHYAYRPEVVIYNTSQGCHIKVDDDDDEGADVKRLK